MSEKMVWVFDLDKGTDVRIPERELPPDMVLFREGGERLRYIPRSLVKNGKIHHDSLSEECRKTVVYLRELFQEVFDKSQEAWEDSLRRELRPELALVQWLLTAAAYKHFTEGRRISRRTRRDLFRAARYKKPIPYEMAPFVKRSTTTLPRNKQLEIAVWRYSPECVLDAIGLASEALGELPEGRLGKYLRAVMTQVTDGAV